MAKGYLRAAGITPLRTRARAIPDWVYGAAMEAYFGGRTECHLPRLAAPVVYTDFLSMYPTVQSLARLSEWLTADDLHAEVCTAEAQRTLEAISLAQCLRPPSWPEMRFFALVQPADDVLPLRARYDLSSDNFTIGVNRLTSQAPRWYTGYDLAASALLTGRVPHVVKALTLRASGKTDTLQSVRLRGRIAIDPRNEDIFRRLVELRAAMKTVADVPDGERDRLRSVLKVVANSGSYGIFAEMNPQDLPEGTTREVRVIGGSERFSARSSKPEEPGEYCFPPIAALVTGVARLLLALLERLVRDLGGSYAICDTDSLAILASEAGGFLPCAGGAEIGPQGELGVRLLSWAQVRELVRRIDALKPYGSDVRDSLLKIEDVSFRNGQQIPLFCYGLSAKRYCLFREGPEGPEIVKASEHGLGHLLNPTDPEETQRGPSGAPNWIEEVWRGFVLSQRGENGHNNPDWFRRPAVARHGFTAPALLRPLHRGQKHLPYCDQVKPFNFAATCYCALGGLAEGINPQVCHLIAPFERDARQWEKQDWHDTYSGAVCRITPRETTSRRVARVKSVADIVAEYSAHVEAKGAAPGGGFPDASTKGVLQWRRVRLVYFYRIGKESNRYEEVELGQIGLLDEVQEILENPRKSAWEAIYRPLLSNIPLRKLAAETGIPESLLYRYRKGAVRPSSSPLKRLIGGMRHHLH